MARMVEKLIILNDSGIGLLNKLHAFGTHARPLDATHAQLDPSVERFVRRCCSARGLAEMPSQDSLTRLSGFDQFSKHRQQCSSLLRDYFNTFQFLIDWSSEALATLVDISSSVASSSSTAHSDFFRVDTHADVLMQVLILMHRYAAVHLIIVSLSSGPGSQSSMPLQTQQTPALHCELLLCMYALSTPIGVSEVDTYRLAQLLAKGKADAQSIASPASAQTLAASGGLHSELSTPAMLHALQQDMLPLSLFVGTCLMAFAQLVSKWSTSTQLMPLLRGEGLGGGAGGLSVGAPFDIASDAHAEAYSTVHDRAHKELLFVPHMRNAVLFGFLMCPAELARPGSVSLLTSILKHSYIAVIHRDMLLDCMAEYAVLFDEYKSGKFKLSKVKKQFRDILTEYAAIGNMHFEVRKTLRLNLATMHSALLEQPLLCANKLPQIEALLSAACNEVLWYCSHACQPRPFEARKFVFASDASQITLLIGYIERVYQHLAQHVPDISAYYHAMLTTVDMARLNDAMTHLESHISSTQIVYTQSVQSSLRFIHDYLKQSHAQSSFECVRLHVYRVSCTLATCPTNCTSASVNLIMSALSSIVSHSRYCDFLLSYLSSAQVMNRGQFIWHIGSVLRPTLEEALKPRVQSINECSQVAAYITLCSAACEVPSMFHRLSSIEHAALGASAVKSTQILIDTVLTQLEVLLSNVTGEIEYLRRRVNTSAAHARLVDPQAAAEPMPGAESAIASDALRGLKMWRLAAVQILNAFTSVDRVSVYNVSFDLRRHCIDRISHSFRRALRSIVLTQPGANLQKPTILAARVHDLALVYLSMVERHAIGDEVRQSLQTVLVAELTGCQAGNDSSSHRRSNSQSSEDAPVLHTIVQFYVSVFRRDISTLGLVYSPLRRCFCSRSDAAIQFGSTHDSHSLSSPSLVELHALAQSDGTNEQPPVVKEFDRYTDPAELRALLSLIGLSGVALLDSLLLKIVLRHCVSIKQLLISNQNALSLLSSSRFEDAVKWSDALHQVKVNDMDALTSILASIGSVLQMRALMAHAASHQAAVSTPLITQAFTAVARTVHHDQSFDRLSTPHSTEVKQSSEQFDTYCRQLGVSCHSDSSFAGMNEHDPALIASVSLLRQTSSDASLFSYFGLLSSCMYLGKTWRGSSIHAYSCELRGHRSNLHCSAIAVRALLTAFDAIGIYDTSTNMRDTEPIMRSASLTRELRLYLSRSSCTLLHLHQLHVHALSQSPLLLRSSLSQSISSVAASSSSASGGSISDDPSRSLSTFTVIASGLPCLESFVDCCAPRLSLAHVDQVMPFMILRAMHAQSIERAQGKSFTQQMQEDDKES